MLPTADPSDLRPQVRRNSDGAEVVIKKVATKGLSRTEAKYAESELQVMRSLEPHPFIVRFFDSFQGKSLATAKPGAEPDELHLVMEYCSGGTLQGVIDRAREADEGVPAAEVLGYFSQLVLGVQELHSAGVLHRDLKAENVFISADRVAKLGDFGLSRQLEGPLDVATTTVGTPHHLSPELCAGQSYGPPADVWALGCILHELCTLRWAFNGESLPQIVMAIMRGPDNLRAVYSPILASRYDEATAAAFGCLIRSCLVMAAAERLTAMALLTATPLMQEAAEAQCAAHALPTIAELAASPTTRARMRSAAASKPLLKAQASWARMSAEAEEDEDVDLDEELEVWPPSPVVRTRSGRHDRGGNHRLGAASPASAHSSEESEADSDESRGGQASMGASTGSVELSVDGSLSLSAGSGLGALIEHEITVEAEDHDENGSGAADSSPSPSMLARRRAEAASRATSRASSMAWSTTSSPDGEPGAKSSSQPGAAPAAAGEAETGSESALGARVAALEGALAQALAQVERLSNDLGSCVSAHRELRGEHEAVVKRVGKLEARLVEHGVAESSDDDNAGGDDQEEDDGEVDGCEGTPMARVTTSRIPGL